MRRARRTDGNQAEIVAALREAGAFVEVLSDVGRGVPDLLIAWRGCMALIEVKMPGEKLTPVQMDWHQRWHRRAGPGILVVHSREEALAHLGIYSTRSAAM